MATKRRYYINILKETDDVRKKYEKNSDNIDQGSFNELMSIWNMSYTELLKQNYPFILLPDDDIIRISIDDRNLHWKRWKKQSSARTRIWNSHR